MTSDEETNGEERRSDRTRAAILRAARERLAAQGYDRTTIRAIDAGGASTRRW
jgi:AcrR family transcriptional regulator